MADKIKVTFLGTGSSIPTARRNHPAVLLQYKDETILFDCGEGTQRQFRKAKLNPCKVTKILISHWHGDHVLGLPGLLQTMKMNGYNKKLQLYGPRGTKKHIKEYFGMFKVREGILDLEVHEIEDGEVFRGKDFIVNCKPMDHDAPTNAYSFVVEEKNRIDKTKLAKLKIKDGKVVGELAKGNKVKINGKVVDGKKLLYKEAGRKISFVIDSRKCPNAEDIAEGSDLFICESSYSAEEAEIARDHGHMTSVEAAEIAKKSKVKKLALIHLSQRYEMIPKKILGEAKGELKRVKIEVFVPEDLDSVTI